MPRVEQPAQLKLLTGRGHGTDSGGRKVKTPPNFRRIAPKPPTWLTREAAAEWRRIVPGLQRLDLLKEEDRGVLVGYCETWARFVEATKVIQTEGLTMTGSKGTIVARPEVAIAHNAGRELRAFAVQFGLSPSAEMALGKVAGDGEQDDNPFAGAPAGE